MLQEREREAEKVGAVTMLETLPERPERYVTMDGAEHDLTALDSDTRDALGRLIQFYNWHPPYPQFRTYWRDNNSPVKACLERGHPARDLVRTIAKDLEKRLGIAQGRIEG